MSSGYRDVPRRWYADSVMLQVLLTLCGVSAAASGVYTVWLRGALREWQVRAPSAADVDRARLVEDVIYWGGLLTQIGTVLLFCGWLFVAHRSDRLAGDRRRHSSFWALLPFVPVANAVMPARLLNDVRRATQPDDNPPTQRLLGTWWFCLLTGALLRRVAANLAEADTTIWDFDRTLRTALVADGMLLVAAALGVLLVRETSQRVRTSRYAPEPAPSGTAPATGS